MAFNDLAKEALLEAMKRYGPEITAIQHERARPSSRMNRCWDETKHHKKEPLYNQGESNQEAFTKAVCELLKDICDEFANANGENPGKTVVLTTWEPPAITHPDGEEITVIPLGNTGIEFHFGLFPVYRYREVGVACGWLVKVR